MSKPTKTALEVQHTLNSPCKPLSTYTPNPIHTRHPRKFPPRKPYVAPDAELRRQIFGETQTELDLDLDTTPPDPDCHSDTDTA